MTNLDDPYVRRKFEREADQEGMTTAAWAGIAFVLLLLGGTAIYAFSSDNAKLVPGGVAGIEQSVPPATTGQGGAQSRMPAKDRLD